jgi:Protein of unknown function (DUF2842)
MSARQGQRRAAGKGNGMELSYKARRRWALVILLVGMPIYVVAAVNLIDLFERPTILVELAVYLGLGIFRGIGQADPNSKAERDDPPT